MMPDLIRVTLAGEALTRLSPLLEADRAQAVADLLADNHFRPTARVPTGRVPTARAVPPLVLRLSIQEGRLVFDIRDQGETPLIAHALALGPFRRLIRDYEMLVDSYATAIAEGREARIQAIDMGRRGLHNEGAELLRQRLAAHIELDLETARRLFTLVCVLHTRL